MSYTPKMEIAGPFRMLVPFTELQGVISERTVILRREYDVD
jgi:hypothetical protein